MFHLNLFPYRRFLEQEIERLRSENRALLDRILVLTTGAPLEVQRQSELSAPATPLEPGEKEDGSGLAPDPFKNMSMAELLQDAEQTSIREAAVEILGERGEEIMPGADAENGRQSGLEEELRRDNSLRRLTQRAVASAVSEYVAARQQGRT